MQEDSITRNYNKVINGHKIIFSRINEVNEKRCIVSQRELTRQQLVLLGDIERMFLKLKEAKYYYRTALSYKFDLKTLTKLVLVSLNKNIT
jgi:hypothetical protein